jgi:hypothetical protein
MIAIEGNGAKGVDQNCESGTAQKQWAQTSPTERDDDEQEW